MSGTHSPVDVGHMDLAEIIVKTDGGPWADHNMPCAVCRERPAVLNLDSGHFSPCWSCQTDGWQTKRERRLLRGRK